MADLWWRFFTTHAVLEKNFWCVRETMGNLKAIKLCLEELCVSFDGREGEHNGGGSHPCVSIANIKVTCL